MNVLKKILSFKIEYIGIPLLLSLLIVRFAIKDSIFSITDFNNLIPSEATFDNFDISKRVSLFYNSIFKIIFCFIGISLLLGFIVEKTKKIKPIFQAFNRLSYIGIGLIFFELLNFNVKPLFELFYILSALLLVFSIIHYWGKIRMIQSFNISFIWILTIAFSISFLFREVELSILKSDEISLKYILSISFILVISLLGLLSKFSNLSFKQIIYSSLPLFFIPILSVFSDELYLILNQRCIHILSPNIFYFITLVGILTVCYLRYKRLGNKPVNIKRILNYYILPITLFSISAFTLYYPFIDNPTETYELANPANGMMRLFSYGEFPIIQALSSHVISDFGFMPLYSILNGYNGSLDFLIYKFIPEIFYICIFYYFFMRILKNGVYAFALILLLPFIEYIYLGSYSLIFINIFLIESIFKKYSIKKLISLVMWTLFLCIWKIEIGVSAMAISSLLMACFIILQKFNKKLLIDISKTVGLILIGLLVLIALIYSTSDVNLLSNFKQAISYFGANQAHAHTVVAYAFDKTYYLHFFIFPVILALLLVFYLYRFVRRGFDENLIFNLSIIALLVFYFMNAQRGLVRHSFVEGTEFYISSYFYFIICLFIWDVSKDLKLRKELFVASLILIVFAFRYGEDATTETVFCKLTNRFKETTKLESTNEKLVRTLKKEEFADASYSQIKSFLEQNFGEKSTFIDFSNTPMLYFYTKRNVPSYFNQYMQNTVTEFLQTENIKGFSNYDLPVVVFSWVPDAWWDQTDGVPNTVRYNIIAEHIFKNYVPYTVLNNHYIWVKKNSDILRNSSKLDSAFIHESKKYDLKYYPYLLGKSTKFTANCENIKQWEGTSVLNSVPKKLEKYRNYLELTLPKFDTVIGLKINYYQDSIKAGTFDFCTFKSDQEEKYIIPLSSQYNWLTLNCNIISVLTKEDKEVQVVGARLFKQKK